MLCSNCKIIEICLKPHETAICENGHYLCGNCLAQVSEKCILCDGRVMDNEENAWVRVQPNWTPEMIREWSMQSEFVNNECMESVNDDSCDRSEDCDAASMNLLYSRGEAFEVESPQNSDSVNISDSKWIQPLVWNDVYPRAQDQFSKSSSNRSKQKRYMKIGSSEDRSTPVKKDTRQKLVDQKKEEIREKIMEEIFKSFKDDLRSHTGPEGYAYVKKFQTIGVSTESTPRLLVEESLSSTSPGLSHESVGSRIPPGLSHESVGSRTPPGLSHESVGSRTPPGLSHESVESRTSPGLSHESVGNRSKSDETQFKEEPQEFLVMNVDTTNVSNPQLPETLKKKSSSSCIDLKLQQIMGTILESVVEKPNESPEDQHFYKFIREKFSHMPLTKLEEIISTIHNEVDSSNSVQICSPCQSDSLTKRPPDLCFMSNSRRAYYNPPIINQPEIVPNPQFQLISFSNLKAGSELRQSEVIDASTLNIPRSPVICPISTCQRAFFVSDFTKHIAVDHTKVPIERIFPRQCKNFFLDPKLVHFGVSRCQVLLLVKDKIKNLGHEKFKDFIPVLVMTTKVSLLELCSSSYRSNSEEVINSTQNFIMIWLTGIMPPQLPIFFSLTVWARSGYMPTCHMVHSGRLYSVRNSQSPEAVRNSGQMLVLSENQVDLLTNRGRQMLELQIAVH